MMRKILLQLDSDLQPSVFDAITALDSADCVLLRHGGVTPENVVPLVHGCMFTRSPRELRNTAIFIGGSVMESAEKILKAVNETQWKPLNVSVMFDPGGCNTTAAAAIFYVSSSIDIKSRRVVVIPGTGPVGQRSAGLAAKRGAYVTVTSRSIEKAEIAATAIEDRFGFRPECAVMREPKDLMGVLDSATAIICCGAAGVELIPEDIWKNHPTLRVVADMNAVPPFGLAGTQTQWCGERVGDKLVYGAVGIGQLKMKLHHLAVASLFETQGQMLDTEGIFALAPDAVDL